jgi:hypothetical protein
VPDAASHDWKRLGEQLVRRRIELDPRYSNRQLFAAERGIGYRTVSDLERARRGNYDDSTIAAVEVAYAVTAGSAARVLAGGELGPLPPLRAVPDRASPDDDPDVAELIRDWPELEAIWALATADGKPYPREERIRLMKAHIDTIRRKVRELEIRAERA